MAIEPKKFFQACNPNKTLILSNPDQQPYYIDFTPARSRQNSKIGLIDELYNIISYDQKSYQLFTGHIGCGKSTELRKLQYQLEQAGYHVVYLDSSEDLVMTDVDISDLLLTIVRQISNSLAEIDILLEAKGFLKLIKEIWQILQMEVEPDNITLQLGIAKLSSKLRDNPNARPRLRQKLEPQTDNLLQLINQELIDPANKALQAIGKQGLVVIVDSLDRLESSQAEYIFDEKGDRLRQFNCHIVYTLPIALNSSSSIARISDGFNGMPKVLPMVRIQNRNGVLNNPGILLLYQMILARAFPHLSATERTQGQYLAEIFDDPATCHRLCTVSGGHVRNLLILLYGCLQKQDAPIDRATLEEVIATQRDSLVRAINAEEWKLLQQVKAQKALVGEAGYQILLRSLFVFEYLDEEGSWFGLNPILAEARQLRD
jgi:hypothetical protein